MIRDELHIDEQGIGWRIVHAVSFEAAHAAIAQAKVSGSVAHTEYDGDNRVPVAEVERDKPTCTCSPAIGMRHSPHCRIFAYEVANDERAGRLPPRMLANVLPGRLLGITKPAETATEQARQDRDLVTFCKAIGAPLRPYQVEAIERISKLMQETPSVEVAVKTGDGKAKERRFMQLDVSIHYNNDHRERFLKYLRQLAGQERAPLKDVYPVWETDEFGDDREVWHGRMRIVRNRKRMRKLKRRGVMFMDLRAKTGNKHPDGYEGPRAWAWFTPHPADLAHRELMHEIKDLTAEEVFGDVPAGTSET